MRLDHVSYVASHEQISDVVNRIGSQIGTAFIDGGVHPKFGTRNFTAPLLNGQYIEIVCPMDHPATDVTPFGRAVKKKLLEGGGWFTWVFELEKITSMEEIFGRKAVEGKRKKPDGTELAWKQIGVLETLESYAFPFFIEWITKTHPSTFGEAIASINKIQINGNPDKLSRLIKNDVLKHLESIGITWEVSNDTQIDDGINLIEFKVNDKLISII
jgi:hypothetical protein